MVSAKPVSRNLPGEAFEGVLLLEAITHYIARGEITRCRVYTNPAIVRDMQLNTSFLDKTENAPKD